MSNSVSVPSVSVLIAVHNGMPYVESALRSIMGQTLRNIEIIVVDDASSDDTSSTLNSLATEDPRIRVETLTKNRRLPGALNRGLELVRAPYVARMDADDLAHPERLAVQKAYLDAHTDITMVSTSVRKITSKGKVFLEREEPFDTFSIRWMSRFLMPLWHPTFMYRRALGDGTPLVYNPAWTVSEDYDLIERVSAVGQVACLPQVLLDYRVHQGSITGSMTPDQKKEGRAMAARFCADLPTCIASGIAPFHELHYTRSLPDRQGLKKMLRALRQMITYDSRIRPDLRPWFYRQMGVLLITKCKDTGLSTREAIQYLLPHGVDFVWAGGVRRLESRGYLPKALQCVPKI